MIDLDLEPERKKLRSFGFVSLVAFGLVGGVVLWRGGLFGFEFGESTRTVALVLFALGAAAALFSLTAPQLNRPLYLTLVLVTFPIGIVLSYTILGFLFFVVISPVGIIFRVFGRDRLRLRSGSAEESFWVKRPQDTGRTDRYFKQY